MNDTTDHPLWKEIPDTCYVKCEVCGHIVDKEETVNGECAEHLTESEAEDFHHCGNPQTKAEHILSVSEKRFFEHYKPFDEKLLGVALRDPGDIDELRAMLDDLHEQIIISNPDLCE